MASELIKQQDADVILSDKKHAALVAASSSALSRCEHVMSIWTHSRSGEMLGNMTIGSHPTPLRQMRQVAAELQDRHRAMTEARFSVLKKCKEAEIKRAEAEKESNPLRKEYLLLEAQELESHAKMTEHPYLGAMREVVRLSNIHDALEKQIREKYGKLDEEVFEQEEARYWVHRALAQSLRDVRYSSRISTGNQELLEQIGLNPSMIRKLLVDFLETTGKQETVSNQFVDEFLALYADEYKQAAFERVKRFGFETVATEVTMLLEKPDPGK